MVVPWFSVLALARVARGLSDRVRKRAFRFLLCTLTSVRTLAMYSGGQKSLDGVVLSVVLSVFETAFETCLTRGFDRDSAYVCTLKGSRVRRKI